MKTILAITKNTNCTIQLIDCKNTKEAIQMMKFIYNKLCEENTCDYDNTYIDEEEGYAQVVNGLEQFEIRMGSLIKKGKRRDTK